MLTTNNLEKGYALCQRLAIIGHGRNIALGRPKIGLSFCLSRTKWKEEQGRARLSAD